MISTPICPPISSLISFANAGLPETVTVRPGGGSDILMADLIFSRTCFWESQGTPGSRVMTLRVMRSEGIICSMSSGGACPMIASISALDAGRVPPLPSLRKSMTPETSAT